MAGRNRRKRSEWCMEHFAAPTLSNGLRAQSQQLHYPICYPGPVDSLYTYHAGAAAPRMSAFMPELARPEPSRLYRWMVLIVISLAMFGNYYVYDCIAPIADLLSKQLGFSDSNIGLLQAIYSIPNVFMVLIGGFILAPLRTSKGVFFFRNPLMNAPVDTIF